jgi:hypothetical protein
MIETTWIGDALKLVGWVYWLVAFTALFFALMKARSIKDGAIRVSIVLLVFGAFPTVMTLQAVRTNLARKAASAHFEMRCKSAGEKIYKTVDSVESVLLMKVRPEGVNFSDQFKLDDPYGRDFGGDAFIKSFLLGRDEKGQLVEKIASRPGYRFVDAVNSKDGKIYRYTGHVDEVWKHNSSYLAGVTQFLMERVESSERGPRYGVTYEDISTPEDRKIWVTGSSLRVIDLRTKEVIAERIGYMIDPGQGDISGGRSPWLVAARSACPVFPQIDSGRKNSAQQAGQTRNFVEKVLKPIQEK